jgi:hypothetical protein
MTLNPGPNDIELSTDQYSAVRGSLSSHHHRAGPRQLAWSLLPPGETTPLALTESPRGVITGNLAAYMTSEMTGRGTSQTFIYFQDNGGLAEGAWHVTATLDDGAPVPIDAYAADEFYAWGRGIGFPQSDPTRTICHPATSDLTVAVAAYVLNGDPDYNPDGAMGARAGYSSLGPRIDGDPGLDIAAPDNPMTLTAPLGGRSRRRRTLCLVERRARGPTWPPRSPCSDSAFRWNSRGASQADADSARRRRTRRRHPDRSRQARR